MISLTDFPYDICNIHVPLRMNCNDDTCRAQCWSDHVRSIMAGRQRECSPRWRRESRQERCQAEWIMLGLYFNAAWRCREEDWRRRASFILFPPVCSSVSVFVYFTSVWTVLIFHQWSVLFVHSLSRFKLSVFKKFQVAQTSRNTAVVMLSNCFELHPTGHQHRVMISDIFTCFCLCLSNRGRIWSLIETEFVLTYLISWIRTPLKYRWTTTSRSNHSSIWQTFFMVFSQVNASIHTCTFITLKRCSL